MSICGEKLTDGFKSEEACLKNLRLIVGLCWRDIGLFGGYCAQIEGNCQVELVESQEVHTVTLKADPGRPGKRVNQLT